MHNLPPNVEVGTGGLVGIDVLRIPVTAIVVSRRSGTATTFIYLHIAQDYNNNDGLIVLCHHITTAEPCACT